MSNGSFKEHLDQLVGWTIVSVDERDDEFTHDLIPVLRLTKQGFNDLFVAVLSDPEGNGAGFLDLYHDNEEEQNDD